LSPSLFRENVNDSVNIATHTTKNESLIFIILWVYKILLFRRNNWV
jgi:hypothetical protein